MSALMDVRLADAAVRPGRRGRPQEAARRRVRTAPAGRMVQPGRQGRPEGVRGPEVGRAVRRGSAEVPPAVLDLGFRLTDRGLAVAMGVIVALMVTALVCVGATAMRVTAEPAASVTPGVSVAESASR
ncbi:hypothetical protein [Granulicoccus sp. GXG6511]|uniref:hypothetical protein n=1 Tax=Granulicoccus sp. GXG6511 TaxID=3381351 RepID=UPI003D7D2C70